MSKLNNPKIAGVIIFIAVVIISLVTSVKIRGMDFDYYVVSEALISSIIVAAIIMISSRLR